MIWNRRWQGWDESLRIGDQFAACAFLDLASERTMPNMHPFPPATSGEGRGLLRPTAKAAGKEVTLVMPAGARAHFAGSADGGAINDDTHGDPVNAPKGFHHGYSRGTARASDQGVLVAAFEGKHGWYWRNRGTAPVTVTLLVEGKYRALIR